MHVDFAQYFVDPVTKEELRLTIEKEDGGCPSMILPDTERSLLDTFDSVTPRYQSTHECHEVFAWLKRAGFVDIEPTAWGSTTFHAIKARSEAS